MKYRYYRRPSTRKALQTFRRLIEAGKLRAGEIVSIRGTFTNKRWYRLTIRTKTEQFQFTGFAWFYSGEGPRGLQQILKWLLIPEEIRERFIDHDFHGDTFIPNSFILR
ncbi:hypothetical protein [Paenibacillus lautus]|uniref:hypothetical protein n=1 Tax=Paenibacillus lautus TaxID=1401 RepID=UPI002DBDFB8F|nr:hypothetical protein [Paenibacillus lautus]MEC0259353.1 hypothetical protein [Paenibacillus lautus]